MTCDSCPRALTADSAELLLPPVQGGSSMMPGKVNPVIAEFVNQLAFRIRGSDAAVAAALDAGAAPAQRDAPAGRVRAAEQPGGSVAARWML